MKLNCQAGHLAAALKHCQPAIPSRTTKPVLKCVQITADAANNSVQVCATDMEVGVRAWLTGEVESAGVVVLDANRLAGILGEATKDTTVEIRGDSGEPTRVVAGRAKYEVPYMDPAEFPAPVECPVEGRHEIAAGPLLGLLRLTAFAVEKKENTRWSVNGLLFDPSASGKLTIAATDTKRLAVATAAAALSNDEVAGKPQIVPLKAVTILERALGDCDSDTSVTIALRATEASFSTPTVMVHTKLIEGRFPPYKDIMPKKSAHTIKLPAADFLCRVRQAAIMTDEESRRVDLKIGGGQMVFSTRAASLGTAEVILALPDCDVEASISFDPHYLTDLFRVLDCETVKFKLTDSTRPAVFTTGADYQHLVMPLSE